MTIAALILAAGRSTRFGAENKLLAMIDGAPMLGRAIRIAREADIADVLVITGHEAEQVEALARAIGVGVIHNLRYREGLASSLQAGIASLPETCEGALVMLGDMPRVTPATLRRLVAASWLASDAPALVPAYNGEWGNPVLIRRVLFPEVLRLTGDAGARKLLVGREDVAVIAVDDPGILADFDTREALAKAGQ
jgi:molybdenum cofactor cytidylyltransferase